MAGIPDRCSVRPRNSWSRCWNYFWRSTERCHSQRPILVTEKRCLFFL